MKKHFHKKHWRTIEPYQIQGEVTEQEKSLSEEEIADNQQESVSDGEGEYSTESDADL